MSANLHHLKSEQTRARLLAAALEVLEGRGLAQLSIHEVARTAGMSSGAVQHHFGSKAELMTAVLGAVLERLEASSDFWPPAHWPLARRAEHFVQQAWAQLYGQPRFAAAWSAYLGAREEAAVHAHVAGQRARLGTRLEARIRASFPELGQGAQATARVQFILSALRGMGLEAPFAPPGATAPQLRVLTTYIQTFSTSEETP